MPGPTPLRQVVNAGEMVEEDSEDVFTTSTKFRWNAKEGCEEECVINSFTAPSRYHLSVALSPFNPKGTCPITLPRAFGKGKWSPSPRETLSLKASALKLETPVSFDDAQDSPFIDHLISGYDEPSIFGEGFPTTPTRAALNYASLSFSPLGPSVGPITPTRILCGVLYAQILDQSPLHAPERFAHKRFMDLSFSPFPRTPEKTLSVSSLERVAATIGETPSKDRSPGSPQLMFRVPFSPLGEQRILSPPKKYVGLWEATECSFSLLPKKAAGTSTVVEGKSTPAAVDAPCKKASAYLEVPLASASHKAKKRSTRIICSVDTSPPRALCPNLTENLFLETFPSITRPIPRPTVQTRVIPHTPLHAAVEPPLGTSPSRALCPNPSDPESFFLETFPNIPGPLPRSPAQILALPPKASDKSRFTAEIFGERPKRMPISGAILARIPPVLPLDPRGLTSRSKFLWLLGVLDA
ncbi:hypothetical protein BOTBODRAFT_189973 [Botryobasidium botryosum FD-172 SS1]|uniref:Uncharacterized protein n=1 Tax=Botryobasidium botryosum (strain FD-172 SS1) TaxID=930990 RepID=A0A067M649_BOTB1|nr:hypothetical protein BOTBODRAFT_189973 [Botryobasidium botryosum FD-172 SS1]